MVLLTQAIEYARKKSHATLVHEHGEEALLNPGLMARINEGTLLPTNKVTYSHAQAEALGQDKKRTRDEENATTNAAPAPPAAEERPAKTQRTEEAEEEEEEDDDGTWHDSH